MALQNFSVNDFLKNYWQQQHLLIKKALPGYKSPLDGDDLAGLSLEEDAESRIIINHGNDRWEIQYGPFAEDHYEKLPKENWTLLVQAVDHWMFEINDLKQHFRFIPDWRIDDIMISYAPIGGGVGPHYDRYDVFLLQASGQRRWKIGQHCDHNTPTSDHDNIRQILNFEEQADYLLNPGDILYVPPGCAHWGTSESDDCITISIGFRAPSHEQFIAQMCDDVASQLSEDLRFTDRELAQQNHPAAIPANIAEQLKSIIEQHLLQPEALIKSFGKLMTQVKYPEIFTPSECESDVLIRRPDARIAYFKHDDYVMLFANGECILLPEDEEIFAQYLADTEQLNRSPLSDEQKLLIEQLIELGVYEDAENDA